MGGRVVDKTNEFFREHVVSVCVGLLSMGCALFSYGWRVSEIAQQARRVGELETRLERLNAQGGQFDSATRQFVDGHTIELNVLKGEIREMRTEMQATAKTLSRIETQVEFLVDHAKKSEK